MVKWAIEREDRKIFSLSDDLSDELLKPCTQGFPLSPDETNNLNDDIKLFVKVFTNYIANEEEIQFDSNFSNRIETIVNRKCNEYPSSYVEYQYACGLTKKLTEELGGEGFELLLFGTLADESDIETSLLTHLRQFVFNELIRFTITIGGGFKSFGLLENYSGYMGGRYIDSDSYRNYEGDM